MKYKPLLNKIIFIMLGLVIFFPPINLIADNDDDILLLFLPAIINNPDNLTEIPEEDVEYFSNLPQRDIDLNEIVFWDDQPVQSNLPTSINKSSSMANSLKKSFLKKVFENSQKYIEQKVISAGNGNKEPAQNFGYAYMNGAKTITNRSVSPMKYSTCDDYYHPFAIDCSGTIYRILSESGLNFEKSVLYAKADILADQKFLNKGLEGTIYENELFFEDLGVQNTKTFDFESGDIVYWQVSKSDTTKTHIGIMVEYKDGTLNFIESHGYSGNRAAKDTIAECLNNPYKSPSDNCKRAMCDKNMAKGYGPSNITPKNREFTTTTRTIGVIRLSLYLPCPDGPKTVTIDGKEWQRCPKGGSYCNNVELYDALSIATAYCENLSLNGGGWRLPTKDELKSLVVCSNNTTTPLFDTQTEVEQHPQTCGDGNDTSFRTPVMDEKFGTYQMSPNLSSTVLDDPAVYNRLWFVDFSDGHSAWYYFHDGCIHSIRCVR